MHFYIFSETLLLEVFFVVMKSYSTARVLVAHLVQLEKTNSKCYSESANARYASMCFIFIALYYQLAF